MRTWVIGSKAECDIVVDSPLVSGRHCQLTQSENGFTLEDLGSTNGTFVNEEPLTKTARVTPGDPITLGRTVPMPWPSGVMRFVGIGRVADNEIVLDDARVSSHHARLIVIVGRETLIEDLGSSNGTFLNSADQRVTRAVPLARSDTVFFGTFTVPAAQLLARVEELQEPGAVPPTPSSGAVGVPVPAPITLRQTTLPTNWPYLAALTQAPILGLVIVGLFGHRASSLVTPENWPSIEHGIASTTFALALAALWLGGSLAVVGFSAGTWRGPADHRETRNSATFLGTSVGMLVALCAASCAVLLTIVYWGSGLAGNWVALGSVLLITSLIGLALGLVISAFCRTWRSVASILGICFVSAFLLGGFIWPLQNMPRPIGVAALVLPARWAFEGLLLLELADHKAPMLADGATPVPELELVEQLFPANSERMGPRADLFALLSMLIGLALVAGFIWSSPRPYRAARSSA
jgi:pSer/pThr/pTyr-binding forkhead associated (FHA) protein